MNIFAPLLRLLEQLLPHVLFSLHQWWLKRRELSSLNAFVEARYKESGKKDIVSISDLLIEEDLVEMTIPLIDERKDTALLVVGKVGDHKTHYFIDLEHLGLPFVVPVTRSLVAPPDWWSKRYLRFKVALNDASVHFYIYDAFGEDKEKFLEHRRYVRDRETLLGMPLVSF